MLTLGFLLGLASMGSGAGTRAAALLLAGIASPSGTASLLRFALRLGAAALRLQAALLLHAAMLFVRAPRGFVAFALDFADAFTLVAGLPRGLCCVFPFALGAAFAFALRPLHFPTASPCVANSGGSMSPISLWISSMYAGALGKGYFPVSPALSSCQAEPTKLDAETMWGPKFGFGWMEKNIVEINHNSIMQSKLSDD